MKTKLSILFAFVLIAQASMAQFHFGVKGGANIMKIQGQSFKDEFKYGYNLGGFAEIGLGGRFSIEPEVLFNQYQTTVDSSFKHVYQNAVNFSNYQNVKLNYLTIPLLLNYKLGSLMTLQAGPSVGILIDQSKNLLQNGKSAFSNGDLAMNGGAVITLGKLRFTGRYVVGLKNISDIGDQNKWKSQGYQLSVGFAL